jgi:hypothetical protein
MKSRAQKSINTLKNFRGGPPAENPVTGKIVETFYILVSSIRVNTLWLA